MMSCVCLIEVSSLEFLKKMLGFFMRILTIALIHNGTRFLWNEMKFSNAQNHAQASEDIWSVINYL